MTVCFWQSIICKIFILSWKTKLYWANLKAIQFFQFFRLEYKFSMNNIFSIFWEQKRMISMNICFVHLQRKYLPLFVMAPIKTMGNTVYVRRYYIGNTFEFFVQYYSFECFKLNTTLSCLKIVHESNVSCYRE